MQTDFETQWGCKRWCDYEPFKTWYDKNKEFIRLAFKRSRLMQSGYEDSILRHCFAYYCLEIERYSRYAVAEFLGVSSQRAVQMARKVMDMARENQREDNSIQWHVCACQKAVQDLQGIAQKIDSLIDANDPIGVLDKLNRLKVIVFDLEANAVKWKECNTKVYS